MPARTVSVRKLSSSSVTWNECLLHQYTQLCRLTLPFAWHVVYDLNRTIFVKRNNRE
jgi:hypothetical protein